MADGRAARVAVFIVIVAGMLVAACLLVGAGFAFAFGEKPEPPSTAAWPSWVKYVCWVVAAFIAVAAVPTGLLVSRLTRPGRR